MEREVKRVRDFKGYSVLAKLQPSLTRINLYNRIIQRPNGKFIPVYRMPLYGLDYEIEKIRNVIRTLMYDKLETN